MWNLGVILYNLNTDKRAFRVYFIHEEYRTDPLGKPLYYKKEEEQGVRCNFTEWAERYGKQVKTSLDYYKFEKEAWCNPPGFNMSVYGRFSGNYSYTYVEVRRCYEVDCLTDDEYFDSKAYFWPILIMPQVYYRLNESDPLRYSLFEDMYFYSDYYNNNRRAMEVTLKDMTVDDLQYDIWPANFPYLHSPRTVDGYAVDRIYDTQELLNKAVYFRFTVRKSPNKTTYIRTIDKVDDLLSYLGGCVGVIIFLGEIIRGYNETLMKLQLGSNIRFDNSYSNNLPDRFGFLTYCCYLVSSRCMPDGLPHDPNYFQMVHFVYEEIEDRLSIDRLFKRLNMCEAALESLIGLETMHCLELLEFESAEEIK